VSFKKFRYLLFFILFSVIAYAQKQTSVKGVITDSKTGEPLPFVTVMFNGTTLGVNTDFDGQYVLTVDSNKKYSTLKVSYLGYKTVLKDIQLGVGQVVNFKLQLEPKTLTEVTVKGKKQKYHNKNNPAVDLIKKVIDHKSENKPGSYDYYEYEKYEKIQLALSNVSEKFKNKKALKKFQFVFDNLDSTKLEGKPVLPVYLRETIADVYNRKKPSKHKEVVKGTKMVSFDGYINSDGVSNYINRMYQDINIYDNNISILSNQFLSPISNNAPLFYKFYIIDTTVVNNHKLIQLGFVPRNHNDFLFQGSIYISQEDSSYAVKKVDMSVNKSINLNFVKEMRILQDFEKDTTKKYALVKDVFMADFGFSVNGKMGLFGEKTVSYKNIKINQPRSDSIYKGLDVEVKEDADKKDESFWETNRHDELSKSEKGVYATMDSIQKVPLFKRTMSIAMLFIAGYKGFGWFEIGPVNTFYSFNPVEGFRLRFGGRTTPQFSKRINFETYAAYGFKDERWKGYIGTTYSFTNKSIYDFPVKSLKASYQKDTKIPGQELQFIQEDNVLLSFKRGVNDKWLYNDYVNLAYLNEFKNHFSFTLGYKYWIQQAAGGLHYNYTDYNDHATDVKNLTTSELSVHLRWAPKEQFYQGKLYRIPIFNQYPIFTLHFTEGVKGMFGSQYNYQNLTLNLYKRFYLSQLGYTDIVIEGGYIFGQVPFPLLDIHRANQTYSYQLQSYNLMNFLEFVSDRYASIMIDHYFNGFFFNKIPLLKKLKWREVITCKVLYGGVRRENNPEYNSNLYRFPEVNGVPTTYIFDKDPYIEASVGIANLFKFFRIDLVKRFTYLDHPNAPSLGIRGRFKFDF
jgi:hypothetical protein